MTIGSELYSDLYIYKFVERIRKRNSTRDIVLLFLAAFLLLIAGFSNLLAVNAFADLDINAAHVAMFIILGTIYILESFIVVMNFGCCRSCHASKLNWRLHRFGDYADWMIEDEIRLVVVGINEEAAHSLEASSRRNRTECDQM